VESPPTKDGLKLFDDMGSLNVVTEHTMNSNSVELPLLTKANYHEWTLVMHVSLEAMELWDVVGLVCKECNKDRRVLAAILHAMPSKMKVGLAVKTAKEAWEAVRSMRISEG
jgi:hypothetical protein